MYRNLSFLISVVLVLSLASAGYGDVVIGDWESTLDNWTTCTWGPASTATLTPGDTNGVTLGSGSLKASGQALGWNWFIIKETGLNYTDFIDNDVFELDVTRLAAEWTVGPNGPNEAYNQFVVFIKGGDPVFELTDANVCLWDGSDDTHTISVDYSSVKPASAPSWLMIAIATDNGGYSAGGTYYLDHARLVESTLACAPFPKDGAMDALSDGILKWKPGRYADKHDVYFGTDYNDVNDANSSWPVATGPDDPNVYKGRQDPNSYDPPGLLEAGQTYYWRIDEVNAAPDYTIYKGNVWTFTIISYYSYSPTPADGTIYVPSYVRPRWSAGVAATKHRMYIGTDYNDVDNVPPGNTSSPLYKGYSTDTAWGNEATEKGLGITDYNTVYYWRIDETNDTLTWKGDIWYFTSALPGGTVVIGDWEDVNDGWELVDACSVSYSTTGATLHNKSFKLEMPEGDWHNAMTRGGVNEVDIKSNDTFKIDVTWVASEWEGTGDVQITNFVINALGLGWTELGPPDNDSSNPTTPGVWNPSLGDDTRTLSWDYSDVNLVDIPNGDATWIMFSIITAHNWSYGHGNYYFDYARLFDSRFASNPDPSNGARDVATDPILSWTPGKFADKHDVYLGTDEDDVTDANRTNQLGVLIRQDHDSNSIDIAADPNVGLLAFDTTYYWRIDEVNDAGPDPCLWQGNVWKFTTGHYLIVDNFESYNPSLADTWKANSKATVSLSTDPVYEGLQAMTIDYDNNDPTPYYSEAFADTDGPDSLEFGTDWTVDGVEALSLRFQGCPDLRGSSSGSDPYQVNGAGWDIEETADGFHYAYTTLDQGTWRAQVRVDSIENTDPWAKAGVMVRETLDPGSKHVAVVITPENGILYQWRETTDGETDSNGITDPNIAAPHWLRITRYQPMAGPAYIYAEHANDVGGSPDSWSQFGPFHYWLLSGAITPIHIGLCVTSHNELELCTAGFSNVYLAKNVTFSDTDGTDIGDPDSDADIGISYNSPEPMYVTLGDSDSNGTVFYDNKDPNATQKGTWTHWGIDLDDFSAQDVNLADVQRMYIGVGDPNNPTQGGTGSVTIDDIRLYAIGCTLSNRSDDFAKADYAPEGSPAGDCVVDYKEVDIMGRDWLKTPPPNPNVDLHVDNKIDFKDFAVLAQFWLEEQMSLWP